MANDPPIVGKRSLVQGQVFLVAMLVAFTLVISWRLFSGRLDPRQAFLWLGICCLCPAAWYCFGFLQTSDNKQSNGLLATAIGWVFVALGFLVHYKLLSEIPPGAPLNQVSDPYITILLLVGLLILVVGGLLSWQAVREIQSSDTLTSE